jgi:hypothetical protein
MMKSSVVLSLTLTSALLASPTLADEGTPPLAATARAPAPQAPPPPPAASAIHAELTTLRVMRDKGLLSQAEYDSALRDIGDSSGARDGNDLTFTVSQFAATLYGFVEADAIWDSTQSFNDTAGAALVARPGTYAGNNSRVQFGIRNSRFGIRVKSPDSRWLRASGVLEMDFLGATLPVGSGQPYLGTEAAFFNNPTFRARHAYLKFETPIVDILMGQYWHLYGWGATYMPNTVDIQGIPGEIYNRTTQIRVSHNFKGDVAQVELAAAAMRPPQRNSGTPEGTAGLRLAFPKIGGMQTIGATGTQISPLSIALSGDLRRFSVAEWSAKPVNSVSATGESVALDIFVPIIPATETRRGNSLSLTGEVSYGHGVADLYTGLTGGVPIAPALPNPTMANPAPTYTPDIDPGIAAFQPTAADPKATTLHLVQWTTLIVGLQYYLPGLDGRLWVSGNYSRSSSANARTLLGTAVGANAAAVTTAQGKVRDHEDWFDVNVFGDPYPGVRFGLEYARFADTYVDGVQAINHRGQFSGYFIF